MSLGHEPDVQIFVKIQEYPTTVYAPSDSEFFDTVEEKTRIVVLSLEEALLEYFGPHIRFHSLDQASLLLWLLAFIPGLHVTGKDDVLAYRAILVYKVHHVDVW